MYISIYALSLIGFMLAVRVVLSMNRSIKSSQKHFLYGLCFSVNLITAFANYHALNINLGFIHLVISIATLVDLFILGRFFKKMGAQ